MPLQQHPNPVLRGNNHLTLDYLNQVQKCVKSLDQMGLQVTNIYFEQIKPCVRVSPNSKTAELQRENKAICFITGGDGQRFKEYQMNVEGIRVVWRDYLH